MFDAAEPGGGRMTRAERGNAGMAGIVGGRRLFVALTPTLLRERAEAASSTGSFSRGIVPVQQRFEGGSSCSLGGGAAAANTQHHQEMWRKDQQYARTPAPAAAAFRSASSRSVMTPEDVRRHSHHDLFSEGDARNARRRDAPPT